MDEFRSTRIRPGAKVDLSKIDPGETFGWSKKDAKEQTRKNQERINELQTLLYAEQQRSLLIILQGMDTGGKDGAIKAIGGAMNPQGVRVQSFKKPTKEELDNGFMWRIRNAAPKKPGEVVFFNRSQYEDVGVVRVHNIVPESEWRPRYAVIRDWEHEISQPGAAIPQGTSILKFWLHIGKEEQWGRLMDRVNEPDKNWKLAESDFKERAYWDDYMKAFSEAIAQTATDEAPWLVIPADKKWMRDLVMTQVVADHLESLAMKYPQPEVTVDELRAKYFPDGKEAQPKKPDAPARATANGAGLKRQFRI